jgi:biopolymer transport protein ExbD
VNFRRKVSGDPVGFQLVPMLDIVFNLLFFFVSSQIFAQWETEIPIQVPTAKTSAIPQRLPGEIIINVDAQGRTIVNARELTETDLLAMLRRLGENFPGQPVVLRADQATPYRHVIRVLDVCRQVDIWNISFATTFAEDVEKAVPPAAP